MKLLREPLAHFLVAGTLLFAGHAWLNRGTEHSASEAAGVVRLTANEVEWLKQSWTRQWQRPPAGDELKGLVADYLKEGRYLATGLDNGRNMYRFSEGADPREFSPNALLYYIR